MGSTIVTPDLEIRNYIGRSHSRQCYYRFKGNGIISIEERELSIDDIIDAYRAGNLQEVFGTGTAATISMIKELKYKDFVMNFPVEQWKTAPELKKRLTAIREGRLPDQYGWMFKV